MKIFCVVILLFVVGCKLHNDDIEEQFPINSKLTYEVFLEAERVMKDSNYVFLQVNAQHGTEYYEPYLLFYNIKYLKLEAYCHNPGKVVSINNKTI